MNPTLMPGPCSGKNMLPKLLTDYYHYMDQALGLLKVKLRTFAVFVYIVQGRN